MNITVSVIIPNYNHAAYLKQRIESVINQSYQNIEIIILDDCSTDDSKDIIEQYRGHEKVKQIIYNEINSGSTFKQWKKGIELAKGEYIWIAESDDIAKPNLLAELIEIIHTNPDIVIAYAQSASDLDAFTTDNGIEIHPLKLYNGKDFIKKLMLTNPAIVNASAVLFKKDVADNYILKEIIKYKYTGDWLFWTYILTKGKIVQCFKILNYFRRHPDSVAAKANKSGTFIFEGLKIILFAKNKMGIILPTSFLKVWASVWAQSYLLNRGKSASIFKSNVRTAISISPLLVFGFLFYYLKFRWLSEYNIAH
jgi:glycosyltransferase involved in cell wall biosynthesis